MNASTDKSLPEFNALSDGSMTFSLRQVADGQVVVSITHTGWADHPIAESRLFEVVGRESLELNLQDWFSGLIFFQDTQAFKPSAEVPEIASSLAKHIAEHLAN